MSQHTVTVLSSGGGARGSTGPRAARTIRRDDPVAFGQHLEAIAKGEMTVE